MIVPMKRTFVLCLAADREQALARLRDLGVLHIDSANADPAGTAFEKDAQSALAAADAALASADAALNTIASAVSKADSALVASATPAANLAEVTALASELSALDTALDSLSRERRRIAPFGNFDPALARGLAAKGVSIALFKIPEGTAIDGIPDTAILDRISSDGNTACYALVGSDAVPEGAEPVALPERRLSDIDAEIDAKEKRRAAIFASLAATARDPGPITAEHARLAEEREFAAARAALGSSGTVCWLSGYAPADTADSLRSAARESGWAVVMRDPRDDEEPPTLIRPPKCFRSVAALFKGLGVAPAYRESDVSVPFLCYFSLFFAMLVGDGGYGLLILAATLFGWKKAGKNAAARPWLILMTVFSIATVAWGLLSNTWFGAAIPACAEWPTVKWLGDQSYHNMMFLCFTIGVSHLMLARLWTAVCKAPDSTCYAEIGWAGVLLTMYLITNNIVGVFHGFPAWGYWLGGVSIALIFLFSVKFNELKTRGAELGMLPLNIMSALGDIISYVRLFAVGLASVKVAENFNNMATGLVGAGKPIWLNALLAVAMVAILLVGHGLNFAMAGLSVLVHAVRLNTLEFSNHKGVSWSGTDFRPFKRSANP